ncbi:hypothetical protein DPMN_034081, partial [Dreissena polymorpha]
DSFKYSNKTFNKYMISGLVCTGYEETITECSANEWWNNTCFDAPLELECRPDTPTRLQGNDLTKGLVEVFFDGTWYTMCGFNFNFKEAAVVCKKLGYKIGTPDIQHSSRDALIYGMTCNGDETDISQCQFTLHPSECCTYPWTVRRCSSSSSDREYTQRAGVICSNNRVRLVSNVNTYQGRVEFQYFGVWGTVCNTNFNQNDARVICKLAGYDTLSNITIHTNANKYGPGSGNLIVEDLQCNGTETDIDECASYPWKENSAKTPCDSHNYDVGVNCRPLTPMRFVGGTNYSGRVEIEYKGVWGTICDNYFDENDAKVICRMKGLNTKSLAIRTNGFYGMGNESILLSNLNCRGDEPDISECSIGYQWGSSYCSHNNDVAVQCNTPVRVREGLTFYSGIVEVYINRGWQRVCKDNFTMGDAIAICNQAGKRDNYHGRVP